MQKRKKITMEVSVFVPVDMSARDARREVRTLINERCNFSAEYDDIKATAVKPMKASVFRRQSSKLVY